MEYSAAASNVRPLALAHQHDLLRTASGDVHPTAYHSSGASHPPDVSAALRVMSLSSVAKSSAKKVVIGKYDHRKPRKWAQSVVSAFSRLQGLHFLQKDYVILEQSQAVPLGDATTLPVLIEVSPESTSSFSSIPTKTHQATFDAR